jgi:MFS family permease
MWCQSTRRRPPAGGSRYPPPYDRPMDRGDRRPLLALLGAVAGASTAYIAVFVVSSLAVLEITGSAVAAGLPSALAVLATAFGAVAVANLGIRWNRPLAVSTGFVVAVIGCGLALAAVAFASLVWLLAANVAFGIGNGALQQTRYAAADSVPADRRAWALGLAVWGSTVGAVFGPNLLGPAEALAENVGADPLVVAIGVPGVLFGIAVVLALLAGRWEGRLPPSADATPAGWAGFQVGPLLRDLRLRAALAAMLGGQVAMVLVMTMTPLHIHAGGGDLVFVGLVISAHTLGMFALAPLTTRLVRWRGPTQVALSGMVVIVAAVALAAVAPPHTGPLLALGLFLLGYGWNMCFVSGSTLLVEGAPSADQTARQGAGDFLVFLAGAIASIGSGALLAGVGFAAMSLVAGAILVVPAAIILRERARAHVAAPG